MDPRAGLTRAGKRSGGSWRRRSVSPARVPPTPGGPSGVQRSSSRWAGTRAHGPAPRPARGGGSGAHERPALTPPGRRRCSTPGFACSFRTARARRPRRSSPPVAGCVLRRSSRRRLPAPEQDLDVDLVVRAVDPGSVVNRVGVDCASGAARAAAQRVLDPAALGESEVAALPTTRQRSVAPSTRTASLALSPTSADTSSADLT